MPVFDTPLYLLVLLVAVSYALGSIPFGLFVAKALGLPDPRTIGSKNIGATNVLRTGSRGAALATLLLDGGKGLVAVLIARAAAGEDAAQLAALAAFLGHIYSAFLSFRGGKGVATFLGALFGLSVWIGLAAAAIWIVTCVITRYSSLSAMVAATAAPVVAWIAGEAGMTILLMLMAAILISRHSENIVRLRAGTESKVGARGR